MIYFSTLRLALGGAAILQNPASPDSIAVAAHIDSITTSIHERVLAAHPRIVARRLEVERANVLTRATGGRSPATLGFALEEVPNGMSVDRGNARLTIDQRIPNFALRGAQRSAANIELARAKARLVAEQRTLTATADGLAVRLVGWSLIRARLAAQDSLLESVEQATTARFATGDARYVDVLRLRTERLRTRTETADAIQEITSARTGIVQLGGGTSISHLIDSLENIGQSGSSVASITAVVSATQKTWLSVLNEARDTMIADTFIVNALRVQLASFDLARAQTDRRAADAARRPDVDLSFGVQRFSSNSNGYTVGPALGVSMSLPFTARGPIKAAVEAADIGVREARAEQQAAHLALKARVMSALARIDAARTRLNLFDTSLMRGARDEREAALSNYRSGTLTLLELMDFERALARADVDRIRASMDFVDSAVELVTAITTE